ncbi:hypothetical protein PESP_a1512 [Pseudoalteromonas espejiana DSM 9414]|uniref:Sensory/regulatory protein RpfC n=1 Tax=Pseudoalteromonas espejiana TaxID=28107 RepID=A0A510XRD7_9GAMM|nr:CHASE domain-containing protein [Pseudoalteromonas espejiana]ASM49619.1 hypothetical protein PESP_a1512 [Pseudoalteromonas espejiana DSM 9414]GEK53586.1 hypothetical protein PES01_04310 [Pseudoalteromonas espejiana]
MAAPHSAVKGLKTSITSQVIIMLLGVVCSIFYQFKADQQLTSQIKETLDTRLQYITNGISQRLELYGYGLSGLKGLISALPHDKINYDVIKNYSRSRNYAQEFPGAGGIGFIKKVADNQLASFIEAAQAERPDHQFALKTIAEHGNSHFIIQYIFPEQPNLAAIGLDIGSEKNRRSAALNAATANGLALTAPLTLVQANQKAQHGFLMLLPVYNTATVAMQPKQRLAQLSGWTYAPLLIDNILSSLDKFGANFLSISDVTDTQTVEFFNLGDKSLSTPYASSKTIEVMGRQWKINLQASQSFLKSSHLKKSYQPLMSGLLLTALIMMALLALQLITYKKAQKNRIILNMEKEHKRALQHANQNLESEVHSRTQQLEEITTLQRSILDSAHYSIIATDKDGLISEFNPAAEKLLKYTASEVIGKFTPFIFHLDSEIQTLIDDLTKQQGQKVALSFDIFLLQAQLNNKNTNQWTYVDKHQQQTQVNLSVTKLLNNKGEAVGYLGIAYDLTRHIEQQQALANAISQAQHASRAKSEFLANMSHEIRTPMNGVFGTLQLLQEENLPDKARNYLKKAIYSTRSLTTIINDILDFSKIEAGKLSIEETPFELDELMHHLESDLLIPANEKNINLEIINNIEHNNWIGDPVRLRQIFLNLISNAIKFTNEGSVSMQVSLKGEDTLSFKVSDTGIGISQQALERLFERFEQADKSTTREYGGTGLGLAITQSLVELMNGTISVSSQLGSGSQFTVTLPLVKAQASAVKANDAALVLPNLTNKTVLIAEDNKINQLVASSFMEATGANIIIANNGIEAVELYEVHEPDIILMDIQMPKMNGLEACKIIKNKNSKQLILALTANVLSEQKRLYAQLFDGYISKPIEKHELIKALQSVGF